MKKTCANCAHYRVCTVHRDRYKVGQPLYWGTMVGEETMFGHIVEIDSNVFIVQTKDGKQHAVES